MTTAVTLVAFPSQYSTVTCDLQSGRKYDRIPFFLQSANLLTSLCASIIGIGINSFVSFVAYPNIIPWSPAPCSCVSVSLTPMAISGDCSSRDTRTPQVSQSKPSLELSSPISFNVFLTILGIDT